MNLKFDDLKCPSCEATMRNGDVYTGHFTSVTKWCDCGFTLIIIPIDKDITYSIKAEPQTITP